MAQSHQGKTKNNHVKGMGGTLGGAQSLAHTILGGVLNGSSGDWQTYSKLRFKGVINRASLQVSSLEAMWAQQSFSNHRLERKLFP